MQIQKVMKTALIAAAAAAALWLLGGFLLPILLPFLLGLAAAMAAERTVRFLGQKLRLPRAAASIISVLAVYALLALGVSVLCRVLFREATGFVRQIPALWQQLSPVLEQLKTRLLTLAERLPDGLGTGLRQALEAFFQNGASLGTKAYDRLFRLASDFLTKLPDAVLFLFTALLSGVMISCELPKIRDVYAARMPEPWRMKSAELLEKLRATLGKWLRAQLKLMSITFLILTLGLMLLNVSYPLLFGLLITLVDALPILGTGTVLLPWSLAEFLRGRTRGGVGFLILYGAAALTRQSLEPRLVGRSIGLDPLLTLGAIYVGYRLFGLLGMLLLPVGAMLLRQICEQLK